MRPNGRRLLRPPPWPRGFSGQFLRWFSSIYEDRTDGSRSSISMLLKQVLAVILFLVGGWPSSQARGFYQSPAALPLPDQDISGPPPPYSFGYRTDRSDGSGVHRETSDGSGSYSSNVRDGRLPYSADSAGFRAKVDSHQPGTPSRGPADVEFLSSTSRIGFGTGLGENGGAPIQVSPSIKTGWAPSPYFFHYSVRTSDGESWRRESRDGAGRVEGSYWLKVEDGGGRKVDYTADASGFKAKVDTSEPGTTSHRPADVSFSSSAAAPSAASQSTSKTSSISSSLSSGTSHPASTSFRLASGDREDPSPYSFGYTIDGVDGGSSHQQSSDGSGNVKGSYSLKVKDGRNRKVDYTADAEGFRATVETNEPGTKSENPAGVSFLSSAPQISSVGDIPAPSNLPTSSAYPFPLSSETKPAAKPYSFAYTADGTDGGSSRAEWSDGTGKVKGHYSLKVKDGRRRKVDYTADAGGFEATVETNEPGTKNHSPAEISFLSSIPEGTAGMPSSWSIGDASSLASGDREAPSPYSFGYTIDGVDGGSSHQQSSDGSGNVKGSYSLKVKDGRSRKVDYTADAEGFRATIDTNEPGTKSENPAGVSFLSSAPQISSVGDIPAPSNLPTSSAYPFPLSSETKPAAKPYSFAYTADGTDGGSSRAEWSDGTGKVKGHYSLKVKDGRRRKVDYTADAEGFEATVETNEPGTKNHSPAEISFLSSIPERTARMPSSWSIGDASSGTTGEERIGWPHNFDYSVEGADGASSRQEWSDGRGKVEGSYSLKLEDGRNRKVDYTADASGFRANVDTNEPGTGNQSPADVNFRSSASTRPDFNSKAVQTIYHTSAHSSPFTYQKVMATSVSSQPTTSATPSPYGFSYSVEAKDGGNSHREWSDGAGNVEGSYSLKVNDGRRRMVEYKADAGGFRARVDTNEPGTQILYSAPIWWRSSILHGMGPLDRPITPPDQRTGDKSWI